uniref:Uncharacterized protein n=1 Tax=Chlamydomonas euryale TaxID=1486919 RepID=A0A7R9VUD4_9CHLO|mmetsp:Transcript_44754/g.133689  ORF Transcript_44754/g.133689 Transcript_44754/m.133689 type:complete len:104 (+) Transcript_44754:141-452(+)
MRLQACIFLVRMQMLMHQSLQDAIPMVQYLALILANPRAQMPATGAMLQSWDLIAVLRLSRMPVLLHVLSAASHMLYCTCIAEAPAQACSLAADEHISLEGLR